MFACVCMSKRKRERETDKKKIRHTPICALTIQLHGMSERAMSLYTKFDSFGESFLFFAFHNCFCFGVCLGARACACISLPRTWWSILIHWKFLNSRKYVRLCMLNRTKMYVVNVWEQLSDLLLSANHHHFRWMPQLHFSDLISFDAIR